MPPVKVIVHPFHQRQQLIDRIEQTQTPPEWNGWQVDQSSVADLKNWFDQHGDTTWTEIARKVDDALKSKSVTVVRDFLPLIPHCPFPVKSLVDGLIDLVQLVVVCYFYLSFLTSVLIQVFSKSPGRNGMLMTLLIKLSNSSMALSMSFATVRAIFWRSRGKISRPYGEFTNQPPIIGNRIDEL